MIFKMDERSLTDGKQSDRTLSMRSLSNERNRLLNQSIHLREGAGGSQ
jgi:hypothetical protein